MDNNLKQEKLKLWAILFSLLIWQVVAMIVNQRILIVSPIEVFIKLIELAKTPQFFISIFNSFLRIVSGFVLGVVIAVFLAVVSAKFSFIKDLLAPIMLTIKSIPVASFVILSLIWFSSEYLAILISFLMVLPIIYTNVLEGINTTNKQLLEMADVFEMGIVKKIKYIYFFSVFPFFTSAVKVSLGLSWKSGVAAEVIGIPNNSIGEHLFSAKIFLDTSSLLAWTVVIIIISSLFEKLFIKFILYINNKIIKGEDSL